MSQLDSLDEDSWNESTQLLMELRDFESQKRAELMKRERKQLKKRREEILRGLVSGDLSWRSMSDSGMGLVYQADDLSALDGNVTVSVPQVQHFSVRRLSISNIIAPLTLLKYAWTF